MNSQPSSTPSQPCSSPSPGSWRQSDLLDARGTAERLRGVLRRVEITEHGRPWEPAARACRTTVEDLLDNLEVLIGLVPDPPAALPLDVAGDLRRR